MDIKEQKLILGSGVNTDGTSYQGDFCFPYSWLVIAIGEPNGQSDGYKTDVEWSFLVESSGVIATIYNWKDGPNYTGGGRVEDLTDWHIGGHDQRAVELVKALVIGERYEEYNYWTAESPEPDSVYWSSM